jgi:hypothetical protein
VITQAKSLDMAKVHAEIAAHSSNNSNAKMKEIPARGERGYAGPRLAALVPQLLVRRLPRPAAHGASALLRVINEDRVQAGARLRHHGHRDMEIISYVLDWRASPQGLDGNGSTIVPATCSA